ncbi:hypothetical protein TNCV_4039921 [Trichonephila clavipes]|nr:hypothetical protein TNCV_4039921 [Trichonephila clavipes]
MSSFLQPVSVAATKSCRRTRTRKWNMAKRRSNSELYLSYKGSDIVNFIKIQRIKWADHVIRIDEDRTTKKSLQCSNQLAHEERAGQTLDGLMA